jgi:dihydroorotase
LCFVGVLLHNLREDSDGSKVTSDRPHTAQTPTRIHIHTTSQSPDVALINQRTKRNMSTSVPEGTALTITMPDDFHHHFRDGAKTKNVLSHATERFGRCIAMPNLKPPVTTTAIATEYYKHIMDNIPSASADVGFKPLMTLYLTDNTTPEEVKKAKETGFIYAAKYYPAGATTNSDFGVTSLQKVYPALRAMEECGMVLCIHSEVSRADIDIFDRESVFIQEVITPLLKDFTKLTIVMEHISTTSAVEFVKNGPSNLAASITAHHLLYNRNALLVGGIKPHFYCLPILKRETHRLALLEAATSGSPKFFAGTDSAPHTTSTKESGCGCAGVYTAHAAVELYAEAFESQGKLDLLQGFLSEFGAAHYGLEKNERTLTLVKKAWVVPNTYEFGDEDVTPLRAGQKVAWSIEKK